LGGCTHIFFTEWIAHPRHLYLSAADELLLIAGGARVKARGNLKSQILFPVPG
jgi:hypothetical protein